jgi:hypothetical protein
MTPPVKLVHGDKIKSPNWVSPAFAQVFTERGWAEERGVDAQLAVANAIARGGKLASIYYSRIPEILLSVPGRATLASHWLGATPLPDGARVEIEGQVYAVRYRPGNTGAAPSSHLPVNLIPEGKP